MGEKSGTLTEKVNKTYPSKKQSSESVDQKQGNGVTHKSFSVNQPNKTKVRPPKK